MSKLEFNYEMIVNASVEEVFGYLTNLDNYVEMIFSVEEVRGHSGQITDGTTWQVVEKVMGREIIAENRVLELNPSHLFRYEHKSNYNDSTSAWEVKAVDDGTIARHVLGIEVKSFFAPLVIPLFKRYVDKHYKSDMERLERRFNNES